MCAPATHTQGVRFVNPRYVAKGFYPFIQTLKLRINMEVIYNILVKNWAGFLVGAGVTMLIALISTIFGSIIGLFIGVIKTIPVKKSDFLPKRIVLKAVNALLTAYIEIFRGTPMMVQAVVIFYGTAALFGIHMDYMFAAIFIVSINTGAYMSEIVRGGINSIDRGQFEAAHAIGMSHSQTMFNIILPQTIRNILPATSNEFVINIKDTAVLNVIGVAELFFKTKSIYGKNLLFFQTALIACAIYLVLTISTTRILRLLEKKFRGSDSYTLLSSRAKQHEDLAVD